MLGRTNPFMWRRISAMAVLALGAGLFMGLALTNLPLEASGASGSLPLQDDVLPSPYFSPYLSPTPTPACGKAWRMVSAHSNSFELSAVAAASANDLWAVGGPYRTFDTLIMRWDGTAWKQSPSPNPGDDHNHLVAISIVSVNDIWAAGYYEEDDVDRTLILRWDGSQWSVVPSPNLGDEDNYLYGIATVSANDVWAVGNYELGPRANSTLVLHWDGAQWSVVPSPDAGLGSKFLRGVAAVSADDDWAVGYYSEVGGLFERYKTLIEHWDGSQWSVVPSPNVSTDRDNHLFGVAALSANNVWP